MTIHQLATGIWAAALVLGGCVGSTEGRSTGDSIEVAAERLRALVLQGNDVDVTGFVGANGIACGDSMIERARVLRDLKDSNSWLHIYLFSKEGFPSKPGASALGATLAQYFRQARDLEIKIEMANSDYGCARYRSSNVSSWPEICFVREGDNWVFADSPYSCP